MYYVYILKSEIKEKTYVGFTNNLERRIKEHNSGKSKFTGKYTPWRVIYQEKFATLVEARVRELYLKSAAGRKFRKNYLMTICPRSSAG